MRFLVLGGGTWGITLAWVLHRNGHRVRVWEFDPAVVETLVRDRRHPRLPHLELPADLEIGGDLPAALEGVEGIVCVVPAAHVRATFQRIAAAGYGGQLIVIASKGIEQETHALMSDVVGEVLGEAAGPRIAVLSGPSHAEEVSRESPTAVTATAPELKLAERVRELFATSRFRLYTQTDLVGVELAAALKNVIAIACGISDGLGFGDNAKAAIMTRGLSEIVRLGQALGARVETFYGLAGVGDLIVTCTSAHSRNRNFGYLIGQGRSPEEALAEVGMVVEGYYTVRSAGELAREQAVEMPITVAVGSILFGGVAPLDAVSALMMREPKSELQG